VLGGPYDRRGFGLIKPGTTNSSQGQGRSDEQTQEDGAYAYQRLNLVTVGKAQKRKARTSNRTREIRQSGIIGGLRETSRGWNREPALQSKEQER
jgi:hypothetical protein